MVICDRFMDSTRVYQGYAGGVDMALIAVLEQIGGSAAHRPDLTFDLDVARPSLELASGGGRQREDRFERRDLAFHQALREGFRAIAGREPHRCRLIDATGAIKRAVFADDLGRIVAAGWPASTPHERRSMIRAKAAITRAGGQSSIGHEAAEQRTDRAPIGRPAAPRLADRRVRAASARRPSPIGLPASCCASRSRRNGRDRHTRLDVPRPRSVRAWCSGRAAIPICSLSSGASMTSAKRLKTEIAVEDAREATGVLRHDGRRRRLADRASSIPPTISIQTPPMRLLKILEEPPAAFDLSCRQPPPRDSAAHHPVALPSGSICDRFHRADVRCEHDVCGEAAEEDADTRASRRRALRAASPGRALELPGAQGAEHFAEFRRLVAELRAASTAGSPGDCRQVSGRARSGGGFRHFSASSLLAWIAERSPPLALAAQKGAALAEAHDEITHSIRQTNALNLDRRQTDPRSVHGVEEAMQGGLTSLETANHDRTEDFYITTAISYPNGASAYRPRL